MKIIFVFILLFSSNSNVAAAAEGNYLVRCNEKLIKVIIEDIFTPPVASRVHVYPNIAAYEIIVLNDSSIKSLQPILKDFISIPKPTDKIDYDIAAMIAFCRVAKKLVYSEHLISGFEQNEIQLLKNKKIDTLLINKSIVYGNIVALHIIDYLLKDNYDYTRTLIRYELINHPSAWKPTPPEYMNALEPNWLYVRSFVFDSSTIVRAIPNIEYSEDKNSTYFKNALVLYNTSKKLTKYQLATAQYWDDNPNTAISNGHMTYFIHKASPAGHWLRIAGQNIKELKYHVTKTAEIYTLLTLGIYEGFISCWKEKYHSNAVRPENYINKMFDPKWKPIIETPPFPEYTSGHSVISGVSSTILSQLISENKSFIDSSEMEYGIPPRMFKSFKAAAQDASISRYYGGIHYMPSLDNGLLQGAEIANILIQKIKGHDKKN